MKKILVGLDGSARQASLLSAAVDIARRTQSKLVLYRAVGLPSELPPEAYLMAPAEVMHILKQRARADLDEAAKDLTEDLIASRQVTVATPWQGICDAAKDNDVDLVMVGSHGYDTVDRILGTTAAKVVNHADRSVMVVRAPERLVEP